MIFLDIPHNAGMGNQMFMFAYAYGVAKKQKQKLYVLMCNEEEMRPIIFKYLKIIEKKDICWLTVNAKLDKFFKWKISGAIHKLVRWYPFKNYHVILRNGRKYQKLPLVKGSVYINGFWESYRYFQEVEKEVKELYQIDCEIENSVRDILKSIQSTESVALHIRMGDFVKLGRNFDFDYYDHAISEMQQRIKDPVFYLVTVDNVVKDYYRDRKNIVIVNINTPHQDIDEWNILCHCKHHITTNSTYSWWAAFLCQYTDKIVIKPSRTRYTMAEGEEYGKNYDDFYPIDWIELKEKDND